MNLLNFLLFSIEQDYFVLQLKAFIAKDILTSGLLYHSQASSALIRTVLKTFQKIVPVLVKSV